MSEKLKNIDSILTALTQGHVPELSVAYMESSGQKLRNGDVDTNNVTLFREDTAEAIYNFMRQTLGKDPLVAE